MRDYKICIVSLILTDLFIEGTEENKIIDEVMEINDRTFKSHKMDEEEGD